MNSNSLDLEQICTILQTDGHGNTLVIYMILESTSQVSAQRSQGANIPTLARHLGPKFVKNLTLPTLSSSLYCMPCGWYTMLSKVNAT